MKVTVLGSGAMGTACAVLLAEHPGQPVALWSRDASLASEMRSTRENKRLLPGISIPSSVLVTSEIEEAVEKTELFVVAIPTSFLRSALQNIAPRLGSNIPIVSVVKGFENETFQRPSQIIAEVLGNRSIVALGGPSHAEEISRRLPASVVAASGDVALANQVQTLFSTDRFRVYTNMDIIGVELGGALKNVIALAAGICDGMGFGDNAKAALITRGLVEMTRFGKALGAEEGTFSGLAGLGDLVTTCVSPFGRNRKVGERLGKGEKIDDILGSMDAVAEGVNTSRSVYEFSLKLGIELPITREVHDVLFLGKSPLNATTDLMLRPQRRE